MTDQATTTIMPQDPAKQPVVHSVVTDHPLYGTTSKDGVFQDQSVVWNSPLPSQKAPPHPFVAGLKIVRIFMVPQVSVEIISVSDDGKVGVRDTIPWSHVRWTQEAMTPDICIDEIAAAESAAEEGEEEEGEEEEIVEAPPPPAAVGGLQPLPPVANGS